MILLSIFGEIAVIFHFAFYAKKHRAADFARCVKNALGKCREFFLKNFLEKPKPGPLLRENRASD
jgi:hypothetical protein